MTKYIEAPNEFQFFESVANGETNVIAPGIEGLRTITTEGSDGVLIQRVVHERAERTFIKAFDEAGILIIDGPQISIDPDVEVFAKEFISYIS